MMQRIKSFWMLSEHVLQSGKREPAFLGKPGTSKYFKVDVAGDDLLKQQRKTFDRL